MAYSIDRDRIMNKKELYRLPKKDQKALLNHWRLCYDTETIKKELGLSTTAFYSLLKRLDLPTNLKAYKDSQPSLLGEDVTHPKIDSNTPTSPSKAFDVEIGVSGRIDANELSSVIKIAHDLNLDITIKS